MTRAALVALALLSACGGHKGDGKPTASTTRLAPLVLSPLVPANVIGVLAFDFSKDWLADTARLGGMSPEAARALRDDLDLYVKKSTGLELGEVHAGTIFATADQQFGIVLREVGGALPKPVDDASVAVARFEDALVVGTPGAVAAALAVAHGQAKGLAADAPLAKLFAHEAPGAAIALAVDATAIPDPTVQAQIGRFGATHVVLAVGSGRVSVVVHGDGKKLAELAKLIETQLAAAASMLAAQKTQVLASASPERGFDPEALGVITGAHGIAQLVRKIHPRVDGDDLRVDLAIELPDTMMLVSGVGVLSAIAVPAFMKYVRKSKTTEATAVVRELDRRVVAYYQANHKLPASIPPTPPLGACCKLPEGECPPDASAWKAWEALPFTIEDATRYSYELESDGTTFTARALGDLDCDGVYSTFEMAGTVKPDGTLASSPGIYKDQELE